MTIEAVTKLTDCVTAEQDIVAIVAFVYCIDDPLEVINLSLELIVIERTIVGLGVNDIVVSTTNVHAAGSYILCGVTSLPSSQAFRRNVETWNFFVNSLILFVLVSRCFNLALESFQVVLELHYIGSINSGLQLFVLVLISIDILAISKSFCWVVAFKLLYEAFTIFEQVTCVVERKLVHLNKVTTTCCRNFNLEIFIRNCATLGQIKVALKQAFCMENVAANIDLIVDENPSVGVADSISLAREVWIVHHDWLQRLVEVGGVDLPTLPVTAWIAGSITTCYKTIVCRLNRFLSFEDKYPWLVTCVCTPLGAITVTINKAMSILTFVETVSINDCFVCNINGRISFAVIDEVRIDAVCFSHSFSTSNLTVSPEISKVTNRIVLIWSDRISLANPCCQISNSFVRKLATFDGIDNLIASSNQFSITCSRLFNHLFLIIDSCSQRTQLCRIGASLYVCYDFNHLVELSFLCEEVRIEVAFCRCSNSSQIQCKCVLVAQSELSHLHVIAVSHNLVELQLEVSVLSFVFFRKSEEYLSKVSCRKLISADIVLLVESNPTFRITLYSLIAIGIHAIDLPLLPVTARILLSIVGCSQSVVCGQHRTRSLDDEVCAISCLTFISVGQAITPLGRYIAVEQVWQALVTCHLSSFKNIEFDWLVKTSSCVSKVLEVLLEFTIRTETPFRHLQINLILIGTSVADSFGNLNPVVLESLCTSIVELQGDRAEIGLWQGFALLIVDECPTFAFANSQVITGKVTAINLPRRPVTIRETTCIVTRNEEVVVRHHCLVSFHDDVSDHLVFITTCIFRTEPGAPLG